MAVQERLRAKFREIRLTGRTFNAFDTEWAELTLEMKSEGVLPDERTCYHRYIEAVDSEARHQLLHVDKVATVQEAQAAMKRFVDTKAAYLEGKPPGGGAPTARAQEVVDKPVCKHCGKGHASENCWDIP